MELFDPRVLKRGSTLSPLRYPGGKAKLASFIQQVFDRNRFAGAHYAEPYAGGAGVALSLLAFEYVDEIHLNDLSYPVYAFWKSVLDHCDELCKLIADTRVTISEWERQKAIQSAPLRHGVIELGFSTFFLNRTNRSGIIKGGGPIGGFSQEGAWKLDARYYKQTLIARIRWIAERSSRITLHNLDAADFLQKMTCQYQKEGIFTYLDPPYYVKGYRLYENYYVDDDHAQLARMLQGRLNGSWVVSYDDHPYVRQLYKNRRFTSYRLQYTAARRKSGREVMFFSDDLLVPEKNAARQSHFF